MTLGFDARLLVVVLAAYALASTAVSLAVAAFWRHVLSPRDPLSPRAVARRLLTLRVAPAIAGAVGAGIVGAAFAWFEPDLAREEVGLPIVALAALGVALYALGVARALRAACASAALARQWGKLSPWRIAECPVPTWQVQTPFPVVALTGCLRPRLVVAERVAAACTADELAVVVAHEIAHLDARDNLWRAVFSICPDVLALTAAGAALERAWQEATELAADEDATGADEHRRLALASALVKVARLASAPVAPALPASALFRGEPIADRVRRMLTAPAPAEADRRAVPRLVIMLLGASTAAFAALAASQPHLYDLLEIAIRLGR